MYDKKKHVIKDQATISDQITNNQLRNIFEIEISW